MIKTTKSFLYIPVIITLYITNIFGSSPINIPSGVDVEISGEVEVEFVDVEGRGGASYEDDFVKKIETRSPYTQIDKAVLDFKLLYSKNISYRFSLRFDDDGAYADKHYLKYEKDNTRIELGKNRPRIALKRGTEGYPLIGTAYWKGRQYHIDMEKKYGNLRVGASFALKRPLEYDDAAEDKSFRMLVYDDGEKVDGQTSELGLRATYKLSPFKIQAWYYTGKLIDDEDWKKRLHYDFDYYANVEADDILNKDANVNHFWYGGRAELMVLGSLFRGEYIYSEDGFLPRDGFYFEGRRTVNLFSVNNLFTLVRYGQMRIDPFGNVFYPLLKDPHTWKRSLVTLALGYNFTSYAKLKVEYYFLDEETGDTKEKAVEQNRNYQSHVDDNQLLVQLELNF